MVLSRTENKNSHALRRIRPIVGAAVLIMLAPLPAFSQFDDPDPLFGARKANAAPEAKQKPAVDITDDMQSLMVVELGFIKRVCKPTPDQKKKIAAAAAECIEAMNDIAVANQAEQGGAFAGGREIIAVTASGVQLTENPTERIQQEMTKALRPIVSAEQHAAYVEETEQRDRFNREAAVAVAVVLLDRQLMLSDQQRSKLTSRLLDQWKEAESIPIQMYVSNPQYFPELPEVVVQSELDAAQLAVWRSLNKTRFPLYIGTFAMDVWEEDFLK